LLPPIAVYKGIEIRRSHLVLCLPDLSPSVPRAWYEAKIGEWLLVGSLQSIKEHIDEKHRWDETGTVKDRESLVAVP
jgi:hypothetical protein